MKRHYLTVRDVFKDMVHSYMNHKRCKKELESSDSVDPDLIELTWYNFGFYAALANAISSMYSFDSRLPISEVMDEICTSYLQLYGVITEFEIDTLFNEFCKRLSIDANVLETWETEGR